MVHVRVDVSLTKTFVLVVVTDMVVSSGSAREYERERDKQVCREDRIAEEGGRDEAVDTFKVDNSTGAGDGESSECFCREAGLDVADGWDDRGDVAEGQLVVDNDRGYSKRTVGRRLNPSFPPDAALKYSIILLTNCN